MTVTVEPDTRGIDALSGHMDDSVAQLPAAIWDELVAELGDIPPVPVIDPFDDAPWRQLPTIEDMEHLWEASAPLEAMLHKVAIVAHGDGPDLMQFMQHHRWLADMELELKRSREVPDADAEAVDNCGSGGDGSVGSADPQGGGTAVQGEPENGHPVVKGGKTRSGADTGRTQKVSGRGGSRKAA